MTNLLFATSATALLVAAGVPDRDPPQAAFAVTMLPVEKVECERVRTHHAKEVAPVAARPLTREPLADQEKAVLRTDGQGCIVPVVVREDIGRAQR